MNKELYTFITEKRHRVWRKDYCGPDAAAWKEAGLSPRERMADRFARLCGQEEPHFLPGQKLAFIRTVKNLPDVLTEEEWADVRKKHHIHELGYLSNLSPDYAAVMGTVLLKAKETADPCTAKEIDALIELAERDGLDYAADIYPSYGSDAGTAMRGGLEARHALIGPGVFASHGYERTHVKGIENTIKLVCAYVAD